MAQRSLHFPAYVAHQILLFVLFDSVAIIHAGSGLSGLLGSHLQPYDFFYYSGVRAYFEGEWVKAAEHLEKSLLAKDLLFKVRRQCYEECETAGANAFHYLDGAQGNLWDLWALDWVQQKAECMKFCLGKSVSSAALQPVSSDIEYEFSYRNPYNFLQVTYYKLEKLQKAASAAHTYFVANPSHLEMRNNIEKYRRMDGVTADDFQDREADHEKHWVLYDSALQLEASADWAATVEKWGECVSETLRQTEECRIQCETASQLLPHDRGEEGGIHGAFEKAAALSLSLLSCQQSCVTQVSTRPGRVSSQEDFLPTQLEHLHIAQYKAGDVSGAITTLRSLLLFYPTDKDNLENLQLYSETLGGDQESLGTLPAQIEKYVHRSLQEKKLLYFGMENLDFTFTDPDLWTPEDVVPESLRETWNTEKEQMNERMNQGEQQESVDDSGFYAGGSVPQVGVTIAMDHIMLNGTNRVVLDGVMTQKECDTILHLASAAGSVGDGYKGRRSPHTPHETFEGLTVLRAAKLGQEGFVNTSDVKLLHELGDRVNTLLHSYFRSPTGLYVSFTHLVCRSARGDQEGRIDLSHPVHVDNCILEPETKQCWREPPAFTHRDLSAILYLNDNFDGGELFFTDRDAKTVTARVKPSCGRLVGFSSGPVNPHGVTAVTGGKRCALALWFTKEKIYRDMEREETEALWSGTSTEQEPEGGAAPGRSGRSHQPTERSREGVRSQGSKGRRDEL